MNGRRILEHENVRRLTANKKKMLKENEFKVLSTFIIKKQHKQAHDAMKVNESFLIIFLLLPLRFINMKIFLALLSFLPSCYE